MLLLDAFGHMGLYLLYMRRGSEGVASMIFLCLEHPRQQHLCILCGRNAFCVELFGGAVPVHLMRVAFMGQSFRSIFLLLWSPGGKSSTHFFVSLTHVVAYSTHF